MYHEFINHKFRHSIDVLQIGRDILYNTPELANKTDEFRLLSERALLFHDVGRFEENFERYEAECQHNAMSAFTMRINHGDIGYEILKNDEIYGDMRILFAVKYHGQMIEDVYASDLWKQAEKSPHKTEIQQILLLVRDADKMANLKVIKQRDHLREDIFYKQLSQEAKTAGISHQVAEQFFNKQVVKVNTMRTYADRVLLVLSWIFDFNYVYTRRMFAENKYPEYLMKELKTCDVSVKDLERIEQFYKSCLFNVD